MSSSMVGCFGDCALGEGEKPRERGNGMNIVFHAPIMTMHKEKEPNKWYTDMINCLAGLGADPNQLNEFGQAPLCMASYRAQGLIVEKLLQRENINVNIKGRHGRTPLYLAAEEGHIYIVQLLLLHPDIDVNCRNAPRGATPLMAASRRGHSRVVELLLQHPDIIPDLPDRDGNNALQHARTASVKCKLHSFARSRSLENVIPAGTRMATRNICHTSHSSSSSSSSLNSIGESTKRTPARKISLDRACLNTGVNGNQSPALPGGVGRQADAGGAEALPPPARGASARVSTSGSSADGLNVADSPVAARQYSHQQADIKEEESVDSGSPSGSSAPDMAALVMEGCAASPLLRADANTGSRQRLQPADNEGWNLEEDKQNSSRSAPAVLTRQVDNSAARGHKQSETESSVKNKKKDSPKSSSKNCSGSVLQSPGKKSRSGSDAVTPQLSPSSRSPFFAKAKNIFNFGE